MIAGTDDGQRWASQPVRRGLHTDDLVLIRPAEPATQRLARHRLRDWLAAAGWNCDGAEDLLLAVSEAVTNVIDHAYPPGQPGPVHLHAWISSRPVLPDPAASDPAVSGSAMTPALSLPARRVTVTVVDRGRWRAPDGRRDAAGYRGRGLAMMRALTAELHLQPSDAGTTVVLVSPTMASVVPHPLDDDAALARPA